MPVSVSPVMVQAQCEEFEKKLTAVHTKGLENVENEESEQQLEEQTNSHNSHKTLPKSTRRPTQGNTPAFSHTPMHDTHSGNLQETHRISETNLHPLCLHLRTREVQGGHE